MPIISKHVTSRSHPEFIDVYTRDESGKLHVARLNGTEKKEFLEKGRSSNEA